MLRGVVLLGLGSLCACADRSEPKPVDQAVRPARIFAVQDQSHTLEHRFVGRVEALRTVDMTFEVSGPLRELPVLEGQLLSKGALVAALDARDFELAVREAEVEVQLARQDLERKRQVLAQRGIARSLVDDAQSHFELQHVRLDKAREMLADARLVAPFDALVARRYVDNFVTIRAGEKIVRLHDPGQLVVVANVPENLYATAAAEQVLDLQAEFDFAPGVQFPLKLYENGGEAEQLAQTYEVSLIMERPQKWNVLPGMTATVRVRLKDSTAAARGLLVPTSALVSEGSERFHVWVYQPADGAVQRRAVTVGLPQGAGIPVIDGLEAGEMVVATGASQLSAGMRVRVLGDITSQL